MPAKAGMTGILKIYCLGPGFHRGVDKKNDYTI